MSKYKLGDWFAVPLTTSGYAVGRIVRLNTKGILVGYFFGKKYDEIPSIGAVKSYHPEDAMYITRFSGLGLETGAWPVIGSNDLDQLVWKMPVFTRTEDPAIGNRSFSIHYDENDPNKLLKEEVIEYNETNNLPGNGLAGAGFVEARLTRLLDPVAYAALN